MPQTPFLVVGLPRSRTFWTAQFLGVPHDIFMDMTCADDLDGFFAIERGAVDTMLGAVWRGVVARVPDLRLILIHRPVDQVVSSFARAGIRSAAFTSVLRGYAAAMRDPDLHARADLVVTFDGLRQFGVCDQLHQACLGAPADYARWEMLSEQNLQCDMPAVMQGLAARSAPLASLMADLGAPP